MNRSLFDQFLEWFEGGDRMATDVVSNLQSLALVHGAIRSSKRGESVNVQSLLEETIVEEGVALNA